MNDQYEQDEYRRLRDEVSEWTDGVVVEGTDGRANMAAATFQPAAVEGPTVTIAHRGIPQDDGGTERGQPTLESHERLVPGRELKADTALYRRRAGAFHDQHPDFNTVLSRDVTIPTAVHRTLLRMRNGPETAYYLGSHPGVAEDLMKMDPIDAVITVREFGKCLENDELPRDSTYEQYRAVMNQHDLRRRAARGRNG